jgi:hypothetical protein
LSQTRIDSARAEQQASGEAADKGPRPSEMRLRAFVIALVIIPFDNYWVIMTEKVRRGPYPTIISLFANCIFILFVLLALNYVLKRISRKLAFSASEMLLIYTMVARGAPLRGPEIRPTRGASRRRTTTG